MLKVKECQACGQGFDEDNHPAGSALPSIRCRGGIHEGPIIRVPGMSPPSDGKYTVYFVIFSSLVCKQRLYVSVH